MLRLRQADGSGAAMWSPVGRADPAWGTAGVSAIYGGGSDEQNESSLLLADGSLLVGVAIPAGGNELDIALVKYRPDGTIDTSYHGDGVSQVVDLPGDWEGLKDLLLRPTGQVVAIAGNDPGGGNIVTPVQFTAAGNLDATFGTGGIGQGIGIAGENSPGKALLLADGRIVVGSAGSTTCCSDYRANIIRFEADGDADPTFGGGDGVSPTVNLPGGQAEPPVPLLQADGSYLLVTTVGDNGGPTDVAVIKFTSVGNLDTSWGGGDGVSDIVDLNGGDEDGLDAIQLASGAVVVAASADGGATGSDIVLLRLLPSGVLDTTFGGGDGIGPLVDVAGELDYPTGLLQLPDGSFAVLVNAVDGGDTDVTVVRFATDGTPITSYGTNGVAAPIDLGGTDDEAAPDLWLRPDGHLVASGMADRASVDVAAFQFDAVDVAQYGTGVDDWDTAAPNDDTFGGCLHSIVGGTTVADWTATGACTTVDTDPWRAIDADGTGPTAKVAHTTAATTTAAVNLRFGFRAATSQRPGSYLAPVYFEVVAPNA
jgi:uncharacterized delta-60 repeat protein